MNCCGKYESSGCYLTLRKCPPKLVCHSSARPEPVRIGQVSSCKPSVQLIFWANQDVAFNRRFVCLQWMSKATFIGSLIICQISDFSLLQIYINTLQCTRNHFHLKDSTWLWLTVKLFVSVIEKRWRTYIHKSSLRQQLANAMLAT